MCLPSAAMLMCASDVAGVVIGSGSASGRPDASSMRTRQRFMLPDRSDTKYRYRPSGDQTGFQSRHFPLVTAVGGPPTAGTLHTLPPAMAPRRWKYAMRWPWGDQLGRLASVASMRRSFPDCTFATHSSPRLSEFWGLNSTFSVTSASSVPSGFQEGL